MKVKLTFICKTTLEVEDIGELEQEREELVAQIEDLGLSVEVDDEDTDEDDGYAE